MHFSVSWSISTTLGALSDSALPSTFHMLCALQEAISVFKNNVRQNQSHLRAMEGSSFQKLGNFVFFCFINKQQVISTVRIIFTSVFWTSLTKYSLKRLLSWVVFFCSFSLLQGDIIRGLQSAVCSTYEFSSPEITYCNQQSYIIFVLVQNKCMRST